MGFASGSVSFRRFAVAGNAKEMPTLADQELLDKLAAHALKPAEFGSSDEVEYGWSGGRHILDTQFSAEHNIYNEALVFALRIDTNRVPGDLKKAYAIMEEEAIAKGNPSGFLAKSQKKDVKEAVQGRLDEELRSGKFRRSKLVAILWDVPGKMVYASASATTMEQLLEIFERTFGLALEPLSAGSLALRLLEPRGKRREYEDLRPTRFAVGPDGEGQAAEYPWVAKGPEPKDFLGNEFLVWLWHEADAKSSLIPTESSGEVTIFFDKALDLDCVYAQTGKDAIRGVGVSKMPEARDALRVGKVPRKAGIILHAAEQFELTLGAEGLSVGGGKLPEVEDAETPRALFEERITLLRDLGRLIDNLYAAFLKIRASGSWDGQTTSIRRWIAQSGRPVAAMAVA